MAIPFGSGKPALILPTMTLCPDSKMIHSYGYDKDTKALFIRFVHGRKLYRYDNVSSNLVQSMREAVSVGTFFGQRIVKNYTVSYIKETD